MTFVVRKVTVARALARLRKQKTHTSFAGYLCLQQRSAQLGRLEDLQPDFSSFFKHFFAVGNSPLGTPYVKPFTEQKASAQNLWLNENVAGSYAPSSLRSGQPFRQVVNIEARTYSLPTDHAQKAFDFLLYSTPVQAADLAVVLYRDFGFLGDPVSIEDIVDIFAYEFGYAERMGAQPDERFQMLFSVGASEHWEKDWLEVYE